MFRTFSKYFGDETERSKIVSLMAHSRNYFTHYDPKQKAKAADGQDLWALYCKAYVLFQLHILYGLGFDDGAIAKLVEENNPIQEKLNFLKLGV
jgi:hypothetical protein